MAEIKWERVVGSIQPCIYRSSDQRWYIYPSDRFSGWDLVEETSYGPELVEFYDTVAQAKARAEREAAKE